jgi:hypothetical protein
VAIEDVATARAAPEGLELYVGDDIVFDPHVYLQDIAAFRVADLTMPLASVRSPTLRDVEMIHYFIRVQYFYPFCPALASRPRAGHVAQARDDRRNLFEYII